MYPNIENIPTTSCPAIVKQEFNRTGNASRDLIVACCFLFVPAFVGTAFIIFNTVVNQPVKLAPKQIVKIKMPTTYYYAGSDEYQMKPVQHFKQIDCGWEKC